MLLERSAGAEGTGPYRVLVADDEPTILRLTEFVLSRAGYAVRTVINGDEALEMIAEWKPDILVLDVMMPRRDGFAVAEAVRADPEIAHTPIIMLTARAQDSDIERGTLAGADTYLTKPFEPDLLVETVGGYLRRG